MSEAKRSITIMRADDDDRMMAKEALEETRLVNVIRFVEDGE
ncbi:MAG TPA: two-component system response regulator, partial [Nitrospiraceae bacterium]|nr:two-component system response regulator [Nitrospiraceae bacterium]